MLHFCLSVTLEERVGRWRMRSRHLPAASLAACRHMLLLALLLLLAACDSPAPDTTRPAAVPAVVTAAQPAPTLIPIPTLFPTATPPAQPSPTETRPPTATSPPATPIPFGQTVVELNYRVPGLELDRNLDGNVSSELLIRDETTGRAVLRRNQAGILLELQQALLSLQLAEMPEDCPLCVELTFTLPASNLTATGWLTDTQLLASVENFTAVHLGPHFPPGTVLGLRRSASAYYPAHSAAVTGDGRVWIWRATDAAVPAPLPADSVSQSLLSTLDNLAIAELQPTYTAECDGASIDSLHINSGGNGQQTLVICPELALPAPLLPLFGPLVGLMEEALGDTFLTPPARLFPLHGLLGYRRADGAELILFDDGRLEAVDAGGRPLTGTVALSELISLTTTLVDSGQLNTMGAAGPVYEAGSNTLVVRGPEGLLSYQWPPAAAGHAAVAPAVQRLDTLLESLLDAAVSEPTPTPGAAEPTTAPVLVEPTVTPAATP